MSLLKEPLFHFFLLGLAIFAWFGYLNPQAYSSADSDQIIIDAQDVDRMIGQFESTWKRNPTAQELAGLQEALIQQEVLVREARALGLDQGDSVVRNRLAQKMEFLTLSLAQSYQPDDTVLRAHMDDHPERFIQPGKIAFWQIALGTDPDPNETKAALSALNDGADPEQFAQPSLLPATLPSAIAQQVDATFGRGFYDAVESLPFNQWAGPVRSSYGYHLVRVGEVEPARMPAFDMVREDVLFDWRRDLKSELSQAQFETLKEKYEIVAPTEDEIAQRLSNE